MSIFISIIFSICFYIIYSINPSKKIKTIAIFSTFTLLYLANTYVEEITMHENLFFAKQNGILGYLFLPMLSCFIFIVIRKVFKK